MSDGRSRTWNRSGVTNAPSSRSGLPAPTRFAAVWVYAAMPANEVLRRFQSK